MTASKHVEIMCSMIGESETVDSLSEAMCAMYNGKRLSRIDLEDGNVQLYFELKPKRRVRFQLLAT